MQVFFFCARVGPGGVVRNVWVSGRESLGGGRAAGREGGGGLEEFRGFASSAGRCVAFPVRAVAGFGQRKQLSRQRHPACWQNDTTGTLKAGPGQTGPTDKKPAHPCKACTLQQSECNLFLAIKEQGQSSWYSVSAVTARSHFVSMHKWGFPGSLEFGVIVSAATGGSDALFCARQWPLPAWQEVLSWANKKPGVTSKSRDLLPCCPQCLHKSLHLLPSWLQLHFPVLFKLQLGWRTPGPCSLHGVSSAKELLVELKTQLFFLPPLQFLTLIKRLCRREPPLLLQTGPQHRNQELFPPFLPSRWPPTEEKPRPANTSR